MVYASQRKLGVWGLSDLERFGFLCFRRERTKDFADRQSLGEREPRQDTMLTDQIRARSISAYRSGQPPSLLLTRFIEFRVPLAIQSVIDHLHIRGRATDRLGALKYGTAVPVLVAAVQPHLSRPQPLVHR
jgi:hypothetical protein